MFNSAPIQFQRENSGSTQSIPLAFVDGFNTLADKVIDPHAHNEMLYLYYRPYPAGQAKLQDGMSKSIGGLAAGLHRIGVGVAIICEGKQESISESPDGFKVLCFARPSSRNPFRVSQSLKRFIASSMGQSFVIVNGIFNPSCCAVSRLLRRNAIPYAVAPHDPYHPSIFQTNRLAKIVYWYVLEKRMLCGAAAIQVLDKRHGSYLPSCIDKGRIVEVPNGFSEREVDVKSAAVPVGTSKVRCIFLGRLDIHNKGLDLLIEAVGGALKLHPGIDLRLTLQGPHEDKIAVTLRELAKHNGISDRVSIELPDYSKTSSEIILDHDLFVLCSRFEGFSVSTLEAMLARRVVLVSDVAGIAPHVERAGCGSVTSPSPAKFTDALVSLVARRADWARMGQSGRDYVLNHLGWNQIADKMLRDYHANVADFQKFYKNHVARGLIRFAQF